MMHDYDIIIIGGGMVGGSLALALRGSSLRVAVVEAQPVIRKQVNAASKRAIALSWGSRCILEQLDIWHKLSEWAMPIRHIHVSDKGHFGKTRLSADAQKVEALGYVVEASQIESIVSSSLDAGNVDVLSPAILKEYFVDGGAVHVTIKQGDTLNTLSCGLLVGADGGLSRVREQGDFELKEYAYQQQAVTGSLTTESDVRDVAYERFTSEGPIALLPHFDNLYSLVWTMPSELAKEVMGLPKEQFLARLQSRFGQWLGELSLVGECQVFPLNLSYVQDSALNRVILIGNAAHQLHPVAGQGFNLGLRDAVMLADVLLEQQAAGVDELCELYARRRKVDQTLITGFTDNIIKLFSTDNTLFSVVRNSGLLMLDKVPVFKNQFVRQTMGLGSRLARLKVS